MNITVEYELDQWEWQGTTQSVEIDSEDFEGLTDQQITNLLAERIREDGGQKMHFVYQEDDIVREIKDACAEIEKERA